MRKKTLETLLDTAGIFGLRGFDCNLPDDKSLLAKFLPVLPNGKFGLAIDPRNEKLFERNANLSDFKKLSDCWKIIEGNPNFEFPKEQKKWINCYANISALKRKFARVALLLNGKGSASEAAALAAEATKIAGTAKAAQQPAPKTYPFEELEKSCILVVEKKDLADFDKGNAGLEEKALFIDNLLRLKIAQNNKPDTPLFLSAKFSWIFALALCALPFFVASKTQIQVSNLRNLEIEAKKYSDDVGIVHVFRGDESLTQIARFAIGKYNSLVANEKMISQYLKGNGLNAKGYLNGEKIKKGDTLRLKLPTFSNPNHKVLAPAWSFFTGLLNDSLAYITDLYNPQEKAMQRRHNGIDIGARRGTRILSPFSGTALTMEDERGGLMIAVVKENYIIIFMHSEQRFYLNGQTVMAGDPIASVGTSGHTTGPHTHITTGKIEKNGERNFGGIRYKEMNPFTWFKSQ